MIDINIYRVRIGHFDLREKKKNIQSGRRYYMKSRRSGSKSLHSVFIAILLLAAVVDGRNISSWFFGKKAPIHSIADSVLLSPSLFGQFVVLPNQGQGFKMNSNFWARYVYGNKSIVKGIKNYHLNIRSLSKKISEVKYVIKNENPHLLGLSECELRKPFDEKILKVPGYDLLFPRSWTISGYARVVLYVKKTFRYEQVHSIQDQNIQSIWIKGGFEKGKQLYFCHCYREYTSTIGNSLSSQRQYFGKLLSQWEHVFGLKNDGTQEEIHIMGDINIDVLNNKLNNK